MGVVVVVVVALSGRVTSRRLRCEDKVWASSSSRRGA